MLAAGGSVDSLLVHGTCVSISCPDGDVRGALLRGAPGSGKSDLALRFISSFGCEDASASGAKLVADDQVLLSREGDALLARPPGTIAGCLEVRGVGLIKVDHCASATLVVIADLAEAEDVPRLPPDPLPCEEMLGVRVPKLKLYPFELSSPDKLKLVLTGRI
jgi:serine kinase of HPr protein (carbohydrate metabolism regulator)